MSEGRLRIDWFKLYKYIEGIKNSDFRRDLLDRIGENPKSFMSDEDCCLLYAVVRYFKPRICFESGSGKGKSSSYILKAFKDNYTSDSQTGIPSLIGIEQNKSIEIGELIPQGLKKWFHPVRTTIQDFVKSSDFKNLRINLFLHDSSHRYKHQMWEFKTFWPKLFTNGILCSHDVDYNNSFVDFVSSLYVLDGKGLTDFMKSKFMVWMKSVNFGFVIKR